MFILPLNEDGYIGRRAYVLFALVIINAFVLILTYIPPSHSVTVFQRYGFTPVHPNAVSLLTSMFVHGGFWHFAGNMFFLWMFGYRIENTLGRLLFAVMYILCGCGAAALHYAFNSNSSIPCIGASGAISGIVGCYFVLFPRSQFEVLVVFFRWPVKTIQTYTHGAVGAWIGEQAILGLLSETMQFSSVAFWAHIGGFLTGVVLMGLLLLIAPQLRRRGDQVPVVRFVRGTVLDVSGKAIGDAQFELHADFHQPKIVTTDKKGRFTVPNVADGTYSYRARKAQFQTIKGTVVVRRKRRFPSRFNLTMTVSNESQAAGANVKAAPA